MHNVTKEAFLRAKGEVRDELLYDMLDGIYDKVGGCRQQMEPRVKKLENRKLVHSTISATGGAIGGFLAVLLLKLKQLI